MVEFISLLNNTASTKRLSDALQAHLATSGIPLPDDECVLDYLATSVRYGLTRVTVAVDSGDVLGVVAWRVEQNSGFVTVFYVLSDLPPEQACTLLNIAMEDLRRQGMHHVYAELPRATPLMAHALQLMDFVSVQRIVMQAPLDGHDWPVTLPSGYTLVSWSDGYQEQAAEVIYRANLGTVDALIIPELQSVSSSARIVRQTMQGRYGTFDTDASGLVLADGDVVAVTLVTRRRNGQGFTAEICVLPDHRRHGLARALMQHTHAVFLEEGILTGILGVTAGNPAQHLYESLGYEEIGAVWTYIWPRPADWPAEKP